MLVFVLTIYALLSTGFSLTQRPLAGQARGLELINSLWTRDERKEIEELKSFTQTICIDTHTLIHKQTLRLGPTTYLINSRTVHAYLHTHIPMLNIHIYIGGGVAKAPISKFQRTSTEKIHLLWMKKKLQSFFKEKASTFHFWK